MSLARLVITAVTVEGRSKTAVARDYGITRFWVQTLVKRFEAESDAAFQPRPRRPHSNPRAVGLEVEDEIVRLRKMLTKNGLDAGAETIAAHLAAAGSRQCQRPQPRSPYSFSTQRAAWSQGAEAPGDRHCRL